jgi:hypothetical protein
MQMKETRQGADGRRGDEEQTKERRPVNSIGDAPSKLI